MERWTPQYPHHSSCYHVIALNAHPARPGRDGLCVELTRVANPALRSAQRRRRYSALRESSSSPPRRAVPAFGSGGLSVQSVLLFGQSPSRHVSRTSRVEHSRSAVLLYSAPIAPRASRGGVLASSVQGMYCDRPPTGPGLLAPTCRVPCACAAQCCVLLCLL